MTNLPDGWHSKTLSEVCDLITDGSHFSPTTQDSGYPYITVRDLSEKGINFANCKFISQESLDELEKNGCRPKAGDILFSKDGTVGKVAQVPDDTKFVVLSSLAILRPNTDFLTSEFLKYALKSPVLLENALGMKTGTALRRVVLRNLKTLEIPIPPIDEQLEIVGLLEDHLSRLDAAMADIERSIILNRSVRAAKLEQLVKPQPSWAPMTLDSFAIKIKNGIFISRASAIKSGVPILRISALRPMKIDFTDLRYTNLQQDDAALKENLLKPGDVLFTRYNGNSELVGACAVVPEMEEPMTHPDKLIRVQLNTKLVDPFWLVMQCSGGVTRKLIRDKVKTTSGQAGISGTDLKALTLNLPPLNVQRERARIYQSFLDSNRHLDSELQTIVASGAALRRSLLESAISGNLTKGAVSV